MSIMKTSIAALAVVVGLSTMANAAPHRRHAMDRTTVQSYEQKNPTFEGNYSVAPGAAGLDANTRAAESFQDQFRNDCAQVTA